MTDREINRATITAFVARALNRAGASAIDAEFGLRVRMAEALDDGRVCIELDDRSVIVVNFEHLVPRENSSFPKEQPGHARR